VAELAGSSCCSADAQASCCEPEAKATCCKAGGTCGCAEGRHRGRDQARVTIRSAKPADLPGVVEAYNAGIAERMATFETDPRTVADLTTWLDDGQPFIVAEENGEVLGFARAGAYSDRCVYSGVGEHAVYVHPRARGRGLGRDLLDALAAESERRGIYKLTSRVFTDNAASLGAHRAAGFEIVGVQRRHGKLAGEWKDCVLVERLLGEAGG
jgi:L-amino acid N-acyltransferase YncA